MIKSYRSRIDKRHQRQLVKTRDRLRKIAARYAPAYWSMNGRVRLEKALERRFDRIIDLATKIVSDHQEIEIRSVKRRLTDEPYILARSFHAD